jgi:cytochrome c551/c552
MFKLIAAFALAVAVAPAAIVQGDASRGAELFKTQKCVTCHSVHGQGGSAAPDLGRRGGRGFTPASLAATLWNHAPAMWSAMEKAGIEKPKLSEQQAADLFAYFYAERYFDARGDAGRGRHVFVDKGCSGCHNLSANSQNIGPSVFKWESVVDPIELARQMWNHAPGMRAAAAKKGIKVPELTVQEMTDLLVYLQSLPEARKLPASFAPASAETGETLFQVKGCAGCHQGANAFPKGTGLRTTAEFAAAMWNHAGSMKQSSEIQPQEMRRIVGYLFALQFEKGPGNATRGEKVLSSKGCNGCHKPAPKASTPYAIVSALWSHGPTMQAKMKEKNVAWPRFTEGEMADLLAAIR